MVIYTGGMKTCRARVPIGNDRDDSDDTGDYNDDDDDYNDDNGGDIRV